MCSAVPRRPNLRLHRKHSRITESTHADFTKTTLDIRPPRQIPTAVKIKMTQNAVGMIENIAENRWSTRQARLFSELLVELGCRVFTVRGDLSEAWEGFDSGAERSGAEAHQSFAQSFLAVL
eukprot:COSAG02_NODE_1078_length_14712_cov_9.462054_6_plen_122_part_00